MRLATNVASEIPEEEVPATISTFSSPTRASISYTSKSIISERSSGNEEIFLPSIQRGLYIPEEYLKGLSGLKRIEPVLSMISATFSSVVFEVIVPELLEKERLNVF